jgi:hypothetical protein
MIERTQMVRGLRRLLAAFPSAALNKGTLRLYAEELADLEPVDFDVAISRAVREWKWRDLPPIAALRELAAENAADRRRERERIRREAEDREALRQQQEEDQRWRETPEETPSDRRRWLREVGRRLGRPVPAAELTPEQVDTEKRRQLKASGEMGARP